MKNPLRKVWKARLLELPLEERSTKSQQVLERLEGLPSFQKSTRIMAYFPLFHEVDTTALLQKLLENNKELYIPRVAGDSLEAKQIHDLKELQDGPYGAKEPAEPATTLLPKEIQVVLIPGLAFDRQGYRLGSGKGYYDRFLKTTSALRIGLAFNEQILPELPHEDHDVPMHLIITDSSLITP